ncbi:MAG: helix-turn-helix transcriptional regulator [Clostridia bacterium]|nr:helix-turn-helix transcriptional regulator [Clostridia bacterium]
MRTIHTSYRSTAFNFHFHHYQDQPTDKPELVTLNTHTVYEILYLADGNALYTVGAKQLRLAPGDLIILNKKAPHIVNVDLRKNKYDRYTLMFDLNLPSPETGDQVFSKYILGDAPDSVVFRKSATQTTPILQLLQKIEAMVLNPTEFLDLELYAQVLLIAEQIHHLIRHESTAKMSTNQYIERIIEYINENIRSKITLQSLSDDLFLSPYYISHIFSKHMKTSLKNYINIQKIHLAEEMIKLGKNPTVVARELGFEYYSTFFNTYKKILGKTPSDN